MRETTAEEYRDNPYTNPTKWPVLEFDIKMVPENQQPKIGSEFDFAVSRFAVKALKASSDGRKIHVVAVRVGARAGSN